jgi:iron complex outermembrane recepter protein
MNGALHPITGLVPQAFAPMIRRQSGTPFVCLKPTPTGQEQPVIQFKFAASGDCEYGRDERLRRESRGVCMRSRVLWSVLLMLIVGLAAPLFAQQGGTVSGTLVNSLSGHVVPNALIILEGATGSRQVRTSSDGKFSFADVPPGRYHLVARADGFLPLRSELTVVAGLQTSDLQINPELHFSEVTSVSPEGKSAFESFQAADVLGGQELTKELQGTLGATLETQPGIALRSFGPGPARPVVRGLDGDRVLIVEDGLRMGDLSSQSGDHGVNVNPAAATSIEVVRGPATLLYGSNAIGGLVNVVTNEIPRAPVRTATGSFTFDAASNGGQAAGAGNVTVGNGRVAVHLSGSGRRAGDYTSPDGDVPNSFNRAGFAEAGLAYTSDNGYFGGSYAYDRSHYGIPLVEEGQTNLDPRRQIFNVRGERRNMAGIFDSVRGSFGVRRYRHDELDGDVVATSFKNDTSEVEVLAHHKAVGRMKGSVGGTVLTRSFATEGEEVLSPAVDQKGFAAYIYEEVAATPHVQFQFGGRVENARFRPAADEPDKDFTNFSGSLGLLLLPTDSMTLAFSLARASRNPALEELYFHGPHAGNNAFENGDPNLQSEHSTGFDASLRWRGAAASGEVTYFFNRIDRFIFRQLSGTIEDDLPETFFVQGDAKLQGIESHLDVRVGPVVWLEGGLDYVRGDLTSIDKPLTRMPPLRGRAGLRFQRNAFQAGGDAVFTAKQDRIYTIDTPDGPVGETPTDAYNLLKLYASYSFASGKATSTITARLDNATDTLYRNHLNYLKDLAPEMGRNFRVVYSVKF